MARDASRRRIAVVHNHDFEGQSDGDSDDPPLSYEANSEVLETAAAVGRALSELGCDPLMVPLRGDTDGLVDLLRSNGASLVFNLVESLGGDESREPEVPAALSAAGIRYTGNDASALRVAHRKDEARGVLAAAGVRVARGMTVWDEGGLDEAGLEAAGYPLFVKPARIDGSIGIDDGSVVGDQDALVARIRYLASAFRGPFLVEHYLPGPEINLSIMPDPFSGLTSATVLDFSACRGSVAPFVTYDCKWRPASPSYAARSVPAGDKVSGASVAAATRTALDAFVAVGGTSYGRVDMRLDEDGRPCVIDVNPNTDIHPGSGFIRSLRLLGLDYTSVVSMLVDRASEAAGQHAHP